MSKVHKSVGFGRACTLKHSFILSVRKHCNDNANLRIELSKKKMQRFLVATLCRDDTSLHAKASTSLSVLQYLAVSTRVLGLKYCSTCKEVLIVT